MPIHYDHHYGGSTIAHNNDVGINLISDGTILAMRWDQHAFVMSGFEVTNMTHHTSSREFSLGNYPTNVVTGQHIEVSLTSRGPVKMMPASQLDTLFLNANALSVDELLKLAYRKIDKRAEEESG
jgi:hypothetical protein